MSSMVTSENRLVGDEQATVSEMLGVVSPEVMSKITKFSLRDYERVMDHLKRELRAHSGEHSTFVESCVKAIDSVLLSSEFIGTVLKTIEAMDNSETDYSNTELSWGIIEALESLGSGSRLERDLRSMMSLLAQTVSDSKLFNFLKRFSAQARDSDLSADERFVLLMLFTLLQEAPNSGYVGRRLAEVRKKLREDEQAGMPKSKVKVSIEEATEVLSKSKAKPTHPICKIRDLFSMELPWDDATLAPTAMLGQKEDDLRIISYDISKTETETGNINQPDIARFCKPDELLVTVFHTSWGKRDPYENGLQLRQHHSGFLSGFQDEADTKIFTINNPQRYQKCSIQYVDYPPILLRPQLPRILTKSKQREYWANVRTWVVITNTFSTYVHYTQGPLVARNLERLIRTGDELLNCMMKSSDGEKETEAVILGANPGLYCAEMVFTALSLGLHYPLNQRFLESRGDRVKSSFAEIKKAISEGQCHDNNLNPYIRHLKVSAAEPSLRPIEKEMAYNSRDQAREPFGRRLAIEPMSVADLVDQYIQMLIPRRAIGESVARAQGQVLSSKSFQEELKQKLKDELHYSDAELRAMEKEYPRFVEIYGKEHKDYHGFRRALASSLRKLRVISGRKNGTGVFIPPSAYVIRATEKTYLEPVSDILDWQYVGHCLHKSWLE